MSLAASFFAPSPRASHYGPAQSMGSDGWITSLAAPRTNAGVMVNEQIAMQFSAVYSAIALISEAIAMLPMTLYQKVGDMRQEVMLHPVAELLRRPNPEMSVVDLVSTRISHALGYGNGTTEIRRTEGGEARELWPLLPDRTRPEPRYAWAPSRGVVYRTSIDGTSVTLESRDVVHVRGPSFDGMVGYSPLRMFRHSIGLGLALEEFGSKFFANDAKSGGFLEHPGKLSDEAHARLKDSMQSQGGLANAHRMKILEEGMKYHAITIAPEDAQFLMTRSFQIEEIARVYRIPLHLLQSHSKSTSWGTGIAQMDQGFVNYTLSPWIIRNEKELERKLLTPEEIASGFYVKHNVNALLRADVETRARIYTAALNKATGWMSRHEVRALEDLNPDGIENESPQPGAASPFPPQQGPRDRTDPKEEE